MTLSNPSSTATLGTSDTATGTIDDDEATPELTIESAAPPKATDVEFTVTLSHPSSGEVTVQYSTGADTTGANQATADTDYTAVSNATLTISGRRRARADHLDDSKTTSTSRTRRSW